MFYLLLAIICSSSIALIFKYSETSNMNRHAVTSANYFVAATISLILILVGDTGRLFAIDLSDAFNRLKPVIFNGAEPVPEASFLWAILVGLAAGLIFFLAFIYYQLSVRSYGVGLSGAFAKIGILVPMSLSLVLWQELPTNLQWFGMALAILAIVMVNRPRRGGFKDALRPALLMLFILGGLAEFGNKLFQKYSLIDYRALFLLTTFATAFIYSTVTLLIFGKKPRRRDLVTGLAVGIPNLFSSYFLIQALTTIPASVAFPAFGAGTIMIINIIGAARFGEKLSNIDRLAMLMIIAALILINI